jgi:hypothetical protein
MPPRFEEGGHPDFQFVDRDIEWRGPHEFPDLAELRHAARS